MQKILTFFQQKIIGLFQEKVSGWGGTGLNFFLLGAGVQKVSDFWVGEVKHILVSWVVG